MAKRKRKNQFAEEVVRKPVVPTTIVTSFKGGVAKTTLSCALAERLCQAGMKTLLLTIDPQADAVYRLGTKLSDEPVHIVKQSANGGSLTVFATNSSTLLDLLYHSDSLGDFEGIVVDTPPEARIGKLDHVNYWIPVDGADAARNVQTLLKGRKDTSTVNLIAMFGIKPSDLTDIARATKSEVYRVGIPRSPTVKAALDSGKSPWNIEPRKRPLRKLLAVVEEMTYQLWDDVYGEDSEIPDAPQRLQAYEVEGY